MWKDELGRILAFNHYYYDKVCPRFISKESYNYV